MAGALDGLRVLDLTWVLAGPYASMILGDLGADVVKVERPPHGDLARTTGPFVANESIYFQSINRGKRSIALDLRSPAGKDLFLQLVEQADVVMENFTAGTMDRLGLGYDVLRARNPRIIYSATSGFGQTGPLKDRPALDIVIQGMGGVMSITGYPDGPPARPGLSLGDIAAGLYAAIGVLAALQERGAAARGRCWTSRCWTARSRSWRTRWRGTSRRGSSRGGSGRDIRRRRRSRPSPRRMAGWCWR